MNEADIYTLPAELSGLLIGWYTRNRRDVPWRRSKDPYFIWISEVMLQQTQNKTVIPYFERWIQTFPTLTDLAGADMDIILKLWEGLGYYNRAANLRKGARFILENFGGVIPSQVSELLSIPGIGPYTAAAIASIAFDQREGVVDGNTKRVMSRLFEIYTDSRTRAFHQTCRTLIERSYFDHAPSEMNQAWMELGALVCSKAPKCHICPIRDYCESYQHNTMEDFPVRPAKNAVPLRKGAIFIIEEKGKYLLVRRQPGKMLPGLWEFPNTYYDEAPLADFTLANDIDLLSNYREHAVHQYSHFKVDFQVYSATLRTPWWNAYWDKFEWVNPEELETYARPQVHIKAMKIAGLSDR